MEAVFDKLSVTLRDENGTYIFDKLRSFEEYDDTIEFTTEVPHIAHGIERGWVGDLTCNLNGSPIEDWDKKATAVKMVKDVLCVRINICMEIDSIIIWRYIFLKD